MGFSALPAASKAIETTILAVAEACYAIISFSSSLSVTSLTSSQQPFPEIWLKSNTSFRVLTECPLVIMLMFQLYSQFMETNIPVLIKVMMDALSLQAPTLQSVAGLGTPAGTGKQTSKADKSLKRIYFSRTRELVAAQGCRRPNGNCQAVSEPTTTH